MLAGTPGTHETAPGQDNAPGHCHLLIDGVESEALLVLLDGYGVCASAGSACASGAMEPSHVLMAMGYSAQQALGALRLTLGHGTTDADVELALRAVPAAVARLRGSPPRCRACLRREPLCDRREPLRDVGSPGMMRVLVAMSGGVDSSVAAALMLEQGHEVVGATMKLWGGPSDSGCCSVADVEDARRVCQQLGVDHHVFNFTSEFERQVVAPMSPPTARPGPRTPASRATPT